MKSLRLPGKPLADICGLPMIVQVWRRAMEAGLGPVCVAAGEPEIAEAVTKAGGTAVLTDPEHPSGSDRIFEAHRSHAYQHLALAWGHRAVTLLVAAINVCWLTPIAILVALNVVTGATGVVVAYLPLILGAARLGAGAVSRPSVG